MTDQRLVTTTDAGIAAPEFSQSVGPNGPVLLQGHYLSQKMAQFNRSGFRSRTCTRR
jgi:catalase